MNIKIDKKIRKPLLFLALCIGVVALTIVSGLIVYHLLAALGVHPFPASMIGTLSGVAIGGGAVGAMVIYEEESN